MGPLLFQRLHHGRNRSMFRLGGVNCKAVRNKEFVMQGIMQGFHTVKTWCHRWPHNLWNKFALRWLGNNYEVVRDCPVIVSVLSAVPKRNSNGIH